MTNCVHDSSKHKAYKPADADTQSSHIQCRLNFPRSVLFRNFTGGAPRERQEGGILEMGEISPTGKLESDGGVSPWSAGQ